MAIPDRDDIFFKSSPWLDLRDRAVQYATQRLYESLEPGCENPMADGNLVRMLGLIFDAEKHMIPTAPANALPAGSTVNILTFIDGLPPDRQQQILAETIRQLEGTGKDATTERMELVKRVGEKKMQKILALEAVNGHSR